MKKLTLSEMNHVSGGNPAIAFTSTLLLSKIDYDPLIAMGLSTSIALGVSFPFAFAQSRPMNVALAVSTILASGAAYLLYYLTSDKK